MLFIHGICMRISSALYNFEVTVYQVVCKSFSNAVSQQMWFLNSRKVYSRFVCVEDEHIWNCHIGLSFIYPWCYLLTVSELYFFPEFTLWNMKLIITFMIDYITKAIKLKDLKNVKILLNFNVWNLYNLIYVNSNRDR